MYSHGLLVGKTDFCVVCPIIIMLRASLISQWHAIPQNCLRW